MTRPAAGSDSRGAIILGFDYGTRRIGVAVGDTVSASARPLPAVANRQAPDWQAVGELLKRWQPRACVVGLPLGEDGGRQSLTGQAETFAGQLRRRYGVPVYLCDERYSSRAADDELRAARGDGRLRRRLRKGDRDGMAARLILEQFLQQPGAVAESGGAPTPAETIDDDPRSAA